MATMTRASVKDYGLDLIYDGIAESCFRNLFIAA